MRMKCLQEARLWQPRGNHAALTEPCVQANAKKMQVRLQKPRSSSDLAADIVEKALLTGKPYRA